MPIKAANVETTDYSGYWPRSRGTTVGELVRRWAKERTGQAALVFKGQSISWAELNDVTDRLATHLVQRGFHKGDRLGILGPNHPETIYAWIAAAKVGVIPVSLSTRYRKVELEYTLNDAACKGLLTLAADGEHDFVELLGEINAPSVKEIIVYSHHDVTNRGKVWHLGEIIDRTHPVPDLLAMHAPQSFEPLFILYTSGTTGVPKGVVHSHDSFLTSGKAVQADCWHLTREDRVLLSVPFCHMIGHELVANTGVLLGCTVVLLEQYSPAGFINAIESSRITFWAGVPIMLLLPLLRIADLGSRDLSSFRLGVTCGYYMPAEQMRRCADAYGITLLQLVGSTEAGGMLTTYQNDRPEVAYHTVGRALGNEDIKIVDAGDKEVSKGEVGEICYRGANVCLGYWAKPEVTGEEIDADGFWHSGDMGRIVDDEGNVILEGRKKDIIKRGGFNIYPAEIERFLSNLPEVSESIVFGYPDEVLGERICAVLICKPHHEIDPERIKVTCKENMADYKCPDTLTIVDDLPRTPAGKPDKVRIVAEFIKGLCVQPQLFFQ